MTEPADLRARLLAAEPLIGTFVKTPAPQIVEVLGLAGLDFVAIDAEHAPFGPSALDAMAMACASGWRGDDGACPPGLTPPGSALASIWGAAGVIVPHIRSAEEAAEAAAAVKYAGGRRGFSPSTRAGGYGTRATGHVERSDAATTLWCQIEDAEALNRLGRDRRRQGRRLSLPRPCRSRFIAGSAIRHRPLLWPGRRQQWSQPAKVITAPPGLFVSQPEDIAGAITAGFRTIICGSDQSVLLRAGRMLVAEIS